MLYKHFIFSALPVIRVNEVQNRVGCGQGYDLWHHEKWPCFESHPNQPIIPAGTDLVIIIDLHTLEYVPLSIAIEECTDIFLLELNG